MMPPSVWGHYASRTYARCQRNGHQIHDRARFEESVACDGIRRLSGLAELWWRTFELTPVRLAEALIDGKPPVYAQRRAT